MSPACKSWAVLVLACCVAALAACGNAKNGEGSAAAGPGASAAPNAGSPAQPGAAARPPVEVGVVTVQQGSVGLITELPGRLEASRIAQVRARAAGIVQKQLFREGSEVRAGQALYTIDSAPYAAAAASADAGLLRAQANLAQASGLAERLRPLVEANAISRQEFANAVSAQKVAEAEVAVSRATVRTAGINLGYASVTAPISGRIGRSLVTEGALVGQAEATPLAVVQQIDPLFVNFTQSAGEAMKLRAALDSGQLRRATDGAASVTVLMEGGGEYARPGRLLFSDLTVDSTTGQVTLRAEIPNPDRQLLPGLYVRVRLEQAEAVNAIALPQQAVTRTAQGDTVMVVAPDGLVASRKVRIGAAQAGQWIVLEGLQNGEQVMVDGFQKLQMNRGAPVKAVPWQPLGTARAGGAATPPAAPASAPAAK